MTYVVRVRYVQPDGVGYLTDGGHVSKTVRQARRFASYAEAWDYALLQARQIGGAGENWWVEENSARPRSQPSSSS